MTPRCVWGYWHLCTGGRAGAGGGINPACKGVVSNKTNARLSPRVPCPGDLALRIVLTIQLVVDLKAAHMKGQMLRTSSSQAHSLRAIQKTRRTYMPIFTQRDKGAPQMDRPPAHAVPRKTFERCHFSPQCRKIKPSLLCVRACVRACVAYLN